MIFKVFYFHFSLCSLIFLFPICKKDFSAMMTKRNVHLDKRAALLEEKKLKGAVIKDADYHRPTAELFNLDQPVPVPVPVPAAPKAPSMESPPPAASSNPYA